MKTETIKNGNENATKTQAEKIKMLVAEFSKDPDILDFVQRTEARTATTRGHYGDYMTFLSPYASKPAALMIVSMALIAAGADRSGVDAAMQIIKGGA